ncbi:MAG: SUF system Fe-S cluster assembly regulator [Gammaproteobacteria bacterium]|nr:SUF system Fe-S cluster assembly regulator [Gammaproteobacteria bacterium]
MIKIGKLADYALLITDYLASSRDSLCTTEELSKETHLPVATVRKLLKKLVDAKIVNSYRGSNGGYSLSSSPKEISVAKVIVAVEGPIAITECAISNEICSLSNECHLKGNWGILNKFFVDTLNNISIADMSRALSEHPIKLNLGLKSWN